MGSAASVNSPNSAIFKEGTLTDEFGREFQSGCISVVGLHITFDYSILA